MKILLVEDDEIIAQTLLKILRDRHYIVDLATAGDLGWEYAKTYDYDLILLDIVIPKLNGIEFCKKLRKVGNLTPVLLLTAQNSSDKKVIGLDAGADDYVVKPFEISELLARIRVLMRRRNSLTAQILQWKKLSLNSNSHEVIYDNKILNLTPKEYRFLELFLRSGDRVLTREIILDSLWDVEEAPSENAIAAHIKDLRRKLKEVGADPNLIETVYGVGYRLKPLPNSPAEQNQVDENKARVRQKTTKALEGVWHKYEITYNERMAILEQANLAWQEGNLKGELLQQAQWAAHKLAGGLGVFGFARGSHLALEMEQLLKIELAGDRNRQFSELLTALKKSLKPNFKSQLNPVNRNRPVMLIVDNHPELEQQLTSQMTDAGMVFELVTDSKSFQKVLQTKVDAVVWSFSLADATVETLDDFSSIINQKLPLPVILFTDNNDRDNRFKISRLGHHVLLQRASLDVYSVKGIVQALQKFQGRVAKILAVDDDSLILNAIDSLLDPISINLTILDNPLNFWQTITQLQPDLLILDVSMPHFTGIELCQLLRNDIRWRELPILFFTIHNDLSTVHQILTAGANDYISKAQADSELLFKIFNHLNRGQLLTSLVQ